MIDQLGSFIILWQEVLAGTCECIFGAFLQAKAIQAETEGLSDAWEWSCVCVCVWCVGTGGHGWGMCPHGGNTCWEIC